MYRDKIASPIGEIRIEADGTRLLSVLFDSQSEESSRWSPHPNAVTDLAARQLREYFEGSRTTFTNSVRLGGTAFQNEAWSALLQIPFGETSTYGKQAAAIGRPKAVRAIGAANGKNRIGIIVPCHRVIGANGTLTGYGGGMDRKRWLLNHEKRIREQMTGEMRQHA